MILNNSLAIIKVAEHLFVMFMTHKALGWRDFHRYSVGNTSISIIMKGCLVKKLP